MPQVFHLGGGSSNFGLDSHLHRVQLGNGSERVVVQMNANGHIEFSNPVTGNAVSFPFETMYGNVGLEMNGVMSSDSYIGTGKAPSNDDETSNTTNDSASTSTSTSTEVSFYPTSMNAADNLSNYPGFTNALYFGENYLNKTYSQSGSDLTKYTFSCWAKLNNKRENPLFAAGSNDGDENTIFLTRNSGYPGMRWGSSSVGQGDLSPAAMLNDYSGWFHFTVKWDTQQAVAEERLKFFINDNWLRIGTIGHHSDHSRFPAQNAPSTKINTSSVEHLIGGFPRTSQKIDAYIANIQFIDGQALESSAFGQYMVDSNGNTTSAWVPKLYDGDYGQNGFLLDFSKLGLDSSGNINKVYDTAPISGSHSAANDWDAH